MLLTLFLRKQQQQKPLYLKIPLPFCNSVKIIEDQCIWNATMFKEEWFC